MTLTLGRRRSHTARIRAIVSDNFNRANGALGSNWTTGSDTAQTIVSNQAVGASSQLRNALYTGRSFDGDHWSEIQVGSAALSSGDFIGPAVRMQSSGASCYVVVYLWDLAQTPNVERLALFKRVAGTYTELSSVIAPTAPGPPGYTGVGVSSLSAGTRIRLNVFGSELTVTLNGRRIMRITDTAVSSGGSPGIASFGTASIDNWTGGNAVIEPPITDRVQLFTGSPPNNSNNGGASQTYQTQVLVPVAPDQSKAHNFLIVCPVDNNNANNYGVPMDIMYGLRAHDRYNLTIIVPGFGSTDGGSWCADSTDSTAHHETWYVSNLVPWITSNFSISSTEKIWLMGFSRSGFGGMGLLFKHPTVFAKGAFWDWPFSMIWGDGIASGAIYGTQANFDTNYKMTTGAGGYLDTLKTPFQTTKRIWIGAYEAFQTHVAAAHTNFNTYGILHDYDTVQFRGHAWSSGWPERALVAMDAMP